MNEGVGYDLKHSLRVLSLSVVTSQDCRRLLSRKQQILPRIHCFLWDFNVVMKKQDITVRI